MATQQHSSELNSSSSSQSCKVLSLLTAAAYSAAVQVALAGLSCWRQCVLAILQRWIWQS